VTAGDSFDLLSREPEAMTIDEMNQLLVRDRYNRAMIEKALATAALPESWRDYFARRLASAGNAEIDAR